jgi:S-formylglutathione hydrolase FrmB
MDHGSAHLSFDGVTVTKPRAVAMGTKRLAMLSASDKPSMLKRQRPLIGRGAILLLFFASLSAYGQRSSVETIQFQSKLVNATLPYNVILPQDYYISRVTRYPVLYLLHGLSGHYSDWVTHTNIADYATQYRIIVITPEGNDNWYTDSATKTNDKYESYILRELIPDVQKRYRTIETRYGRAVAGLSMGGYGALKFGLKSPGTFIFAASMSGAFDAPHWTETDLKDPGPIRDSVLSVFGAAGSETRKANDIFEIARSLTANRVAGLPYFYLDCGTEDGLIGTNQKFAELLGEKKIAHEYRELPGNHNWAYWDQQVQEVLKIAAQKLQRMPSPASRKRT